MNPDLHQNRKKGTAGKEGKYAFWNKRNIHSPVGRIRKGSLRKNRGRGMDRSRGRKVRREKNPSKTSPSGTKK